MPSTVGSLFAAASVTRTGVVPWGTRILLSQDGGMGTGVYVVALTDEVDSLEHAVSACPLSEDALEELLAARPELTLDGKRPDRRELAHRLAAFWCADEVVLYVGLAGPRERVTISELSDRVAEYYGTPLGARSPHAGGWPLKTLTNLSGLFVHYAYCDDVLIKEGLLLDAFADALADETRAALHDSTHVMPFANLRDARGGRKAHGIKGARAPRRKTGADRPAAPVGVSRTDRRRPPETASPPTRSSDESRFQTQPMRAGDVRSGIIRIPLPAKTLFPMEKASVELDLRGERRACRWDPRYGPDKERSGVLGVGTALTRRLVAEGERLTIRVEDGVVFLD
jgi:hypothetical protein